MNNFSTENHHFFIFRRLSSIQWFHLKYRSRKFIDKKAKRSLLSGCLLIIALGRHKVWIAESEKSLGLINATLCESMRLTLCKSGFVCEAKFSNQFSDTHVQIFPKHIYTKLKNLFAPFIKTWLQIVHSMFSGTWERIKSDSGGGFI